MIGVFKTNNLFDIDVIPYYLLTADLLIIIIMVKK